MLRVMPALQKPDRDAGQCQGEEDEAKQEDEIVFAQHAQDRQPMLFFRHFRGGQCQAGKMIRVREVNLGIVHFQGGEPADSRAQCSIGHFFDQFGLVAFLVFAGQAEFFSHGLPEINTDPFPGAVCIFHCVGRRGNHADFDGSPGAGRRPACQNDGKDEN